MNYKLIVQFKKESFMIRNKICVQWSLVMTLRHSYMKAQNILSITKEIEVDIVFFIYESPIWWLNKQWYQYFKHLQYIFLQTGTQKNTFKVKIANPLSFGPGNKNHKTQANYDLGLHYHFLSLKKLYETPNLKRIMLFTYLKLLWAYFKFSKNIHCLILRHFFTVFNFSHYLCKIEFNSKQ